eukprot:610426-Rhodomonas_salina.1
MEYRTRRRERAGAYLRAHSSFMHASMLFAFLTLMCCRRPYCPLVPRYGCMRILRVRTALPVCECEKESVFR